MLKGSLSISRVNCSQGPDYVKVAIRDEASGCRVAEVHVGLEGFSQALFGLGHVECEFEPPPEVPGLIGARHECKTVVVALPDRYRLKATDPDVRAALAEHEVDGWRADGDSQVDNPHNGPAEARRIIYRRYIGADGAPVELPPR